MNRQMRENMEIAGLAHRRYPGQPLDLAIMQFRSDRGRAGLGALDERHRRRPGRKQIRNLKRATRDQVTYDLLIDVTPRQRYARQPIPEPWEISATSTITVETVPARFDHRCLPFSGYLLGEQSGRWAVAQELRALRREMRKS